MIEQHSQPRVYHQVNYRCSLSCFLVSNKRCKFDVSYLDFICIIFCKFMQFKWVSHIKVNGGLQKQRISPKPSIFNAYKFSQETKLKKAHD